MTKWPTLYLATSGLRDLAGPIQIADCKFQLAQVLPLGVGRPQLGMGVTLGSVVLRAADQRPPAAEHLKRLANDALVIVPRAR